MKKKIIYFCIVSLLLGFLILFGIVYMLSAILIGEKKNQAEAPASGYQSWFDPIGYLSCKYESGGDPDDVGGDNGNAYGKYQLDWRYDLQKFIDWSYHRNSSMYQEFWEFADKRNGEALKGNEKLYAAWHSIYARDPFQFEGDQDEFFANEYYWPSSAWLKGKLGIDIEHRSDALKAVVFSHAVRNGPGVSLQSFLGGCDGNSSDEMIIRTMYAHSRKIHTGETSRWTLEEQDALALLAGTLDIYEPSENAAGTIDWSYKRVSIGDVADTGEVAGMPLEQRMTYLFPSGVPNSESQMSQYLTRIAVSILNESGEETTMTLTVHKKLAADIQSAFREMKQIGFRIKAGDTYCYGWRAMVSSSSRSHHSFGSAIDINSDDNPYISSSQTIGGNEYKPGVNPYSVTKEVIAIWKRHGFYWGGEWKSSKDYMHFSFCNH